jgi:hypothetical protein
MRDIDDRQSEAVGGGREHYGGAVAGRERGLHGRLLPHQRIFSVTRAIRHRLFGRSRKINGTSCKSGLFSVAYESPEGKFIRP